MNYFLNKIQTAFEDFMGCDSGLYPPLVIYLKNKT